MSNEYNREENMQERIKSKLSLKNGVLFAVVGCLCFILAWWTTYAAEMIYSQDYSDAFVVFFLTVFFIFAGTKIYKIFAIFSLSVCFMFCMLALWYDIAFMLRYIHIKKVKENALNGESMSCTAFVLCIISVIISVVVIAMGIWLAVRLSLV